jgi:hypothetical protein
MQDCFLDTTENGVLKLKCRLKSVVEVRITGVASQRQETQLDINFQNCNIGAEVAPLLRARPRIYLAQYREIVENFQRSFNITETGVKQITYNLIAHLRKLAKFRFNKFKTLPYLNVWRATQRLARSRCRTETTHLK